MLGIIDILCRGVLYLKLLKFRLYSVWDLPMFLRLQLFSFRKVHDVCWGLLILCVVVYYGHALGGAAWGRVGLSGAE